jgi:ornithine carbamoyltransferase
MKRDFISFASWSRQELSDILSLSKKIKSGELKNFAPLAQKSAAMIFEKQSLRTRVSFEVGIAQLGGHPVFLQQETIGIATRESVHDVASVLSHYNELIIARTAKHQTVVQLAESATVPVINAMTDLVHPCQVLGDYLTLQELKKSTPMTKIVFVGDGNNVVNSWLELSEKMPIHLVISSPTGYEPHPSMLEQAESSKVSKVTLVADPMEAVKDADVIYTDIWPTSKDMGRRQVIFKQHQVNAALLKNAKPDCVVMHRLPANRGEEITRDVLDGKQSIVLEQAENRLHIQKGIVAFLLGHRP